MPLLRVLVLAVVALIAGPAAAKPYLSIPAPPQGTSVFVVQGDITALTGAAFAAMMAAAESAKTDVVVYISSPGGQVDAALDIYNLLHNSKLKSTCVVLDQASSSAFLILQGCKARWAAPGATMVAHQVRTPVQGQGRLAPDQPPGDYAAIYELMNEAMLTEVVTTLQVSLAKHKTAAAALDAAIAARLGLTLIQYRARIADGKEWRLTSTTALAAHAIDGVLSTAGQHGP